MIQATYEDNTFEGTLYFRKYLRRYFRTKVRVLSKYFRTKVRVLSKYFRTKVISMEVLQYNVLSYERSNLFPEVLSYFRKLIFEGLI